MKLSLNQNHILSTFNIIIQLNYAKSSFYSEVLESLNFIKKLVSGEDIISLIWLLKFI